MGEKIICTTCYYKLPRTNFHLLKENPLNEVFAGRVNFEHIVSFLNFRKGGQVQQLVHQFKYRNKKEIGFFMGQVYARDLKNTNWINSIDCIIPIPLHQKKLKKRGFNQSEEFAMGMADTLDIPVNNSTLQRIKFSETQTRKSKYKRWENVKTFFGLRAIK